MIRERLLKFAAVLLLSAGLGAGLAACSSPEARFAEAMSRGGEFYAADNFDKARVEFRNALQLKPNDPEARFQAGRVAEKLQNLREAVQFYRGTLDIKPDHFEAMASLGRIFAIAGAGDKALETVEPGLKARPDDVDLLTVRATALSQKGDRDGARVAAERAVELQPGNTMAVAVLAALYKTANETDKAVALLEKTLAMLPKEVDLRIALAQIYATTGEHDKVIALLREAVKLDPTGTKRRVLLARYLSGRGDLAGAEAELRAGVKATPKDTEAFASLVDFLRVKRGLPAAEQELKTRIAAEPKNVALKFQLGQFYELSAQIPRAEAIYRTVMAEDLTSKESLEARTKIASLAMRRGDFKTADAMILAVLEQNARDTTALQLRGAMALAKGDPKSAIADLRSVLRDQPSAIPVLRTLAQAHLANGEPALAEDVLRQALDVEPMNAAVRLDAALMYLNTGRPASARPLLLQLAQEKPTDAAILDASFRTGVALRDVPAAKSAAVALLAAEPKDPRGPLYMGMVNEADGKTVDAERDYREAVRLGPGTKEPLQALVRLLSKQAKQAAALQTLDLLITQESANPFPAFLKGEVLTSIGRAPEAVAAYGIAKQRAPRWWLAYRGLAGAMAAKGDFAGAIKLLRDAVPIVDEPQPLRAELAAVLERGGQSDAAIAEYEQLNTANPASALVANNLALLIVTHSKDPARLAKALNVAKTLAGSADAGQRATYAWVLFRSGDASNALPLLESAASGAPGNPVYLYRLGMAQAATGQKDKARNSLQEALKQGSRFDGAPEARAKLQELTRG